MNGIEERLSEELKEFAQRAQPGSIRPLSAPAPRRRARAARWLAPVAAATAVVAVAAGVTLAGRAGPNRPASAGPAGMPPFYVTTSWTETGRGTRHVQMTEWATVYGSATGQRLDKLRLPIKWGALGLHYITAAANGRLFAINSGAGVFLLHLAANGRSGRLDRVTVANSVMPDAPAVLSPDGSQLALQTFSCGGGRRCTSGVEVVSLTRKTAPRMWSWQRAMGNMSWSGNGKEILLAVLVNSHMTMSYRLLNVTGPTGNMLAESRPVNLPSELTGEAELAPDGRTAVGPTVQSGPGRHMVTGKIVAASISTGRVLRVVTVAKEQVTNNGPAREDCNVLSLAPQGVQPLVQCYRRFGRIEGSTFTPLPGGPSNWSLNVGWDAAW